MSAIKQLLASHRLSRFFLHCFLLMLAMPCVKGASTAAPLDFSNSWFKPTLEIDDSPYCDGLLKEIRKNFSGPTTSLETNRRPAPAMSVPSLKPAKLQGIFEIDPITGKASSQYPTEYFVPVGGVKVFVQEFLQGGCGGACEAYYQGISLAHIETSHRNYSPSNVGAHLTDLTPSQTGDNSYWQDETGNYYNLIFSDGLIYLLEIGADAKWLTRCQARIEPSTFSAPSNQLLTSAVDSIEKLRMAVQKMTQPGARGSCGSSAADSLYDKRLRSSLARVLYRPQTVGYPARPTGKRSNMQFLEQWSLTGLHEFESFSLFKTQLDQAIRQVAGLYVQSFGLTLSAASELAENNIDTALDLPINDDSSKVDANSKARKLILEHGPLADLMALNLDAAQIDKTASQVGYEAKNTGGDSLLNASVNYPEALAYLIERGGNPNKTNDFGKTPLMYAAQQNSLEATRILLAAGANANATTVFPDYSTSCFYHLSRASMTPLHYAVRYASSELVLLLLENGARTYTKTTANIEDSKSVGETPLDWLHRYGAADAAEPNRNMTTGDAAKLAPLLTPPAAGELRRIALNATTQAETFYKSGDLNAAVGLLKDALQADENYERALSDLSLIGLRAKNPGDAAGAARKLIDNSQDNKLVANAWFNLGLICEQSTYDVVYNTDYPCRQSSSVYSFFNAWEKEPTTTRSNKLVAAITEHKQHCSMTVAGTEVSVLFGESNLDYSSIYVLAPANWSLNRDALQQELTRIAGLYAGRAPVKAPILTNDKHHHLEGMELYVVSSNSLFSSTCKIPGAP